MFEAQTEWVKPDEFPDLRQANTIAIDLETHDPDLKTLGSGAVVGRGKVVGIAVATLMATQDTFRSIMKEEVTLKKVK